MENRILKFRAWHKADKQMLDWFTLHQSAWNTFRGEEPLSLIYEILVARKDDFHVMQFTGLHDKNGKEIYENDVVKFKSRYSEEDYTIAKIGFHDAAFTVEHDEKELLHLVYPDIEIIGNLHQNKNLIQ